MNTTFFGSEKFTSNKGKSADEIVDMIYKHLRHPSGRIKRGCADAILSLNDSWDKNSTLSALKEGSSALEKLGMSKEAKEVSDFVFYNTDWGM